MQFLNLFETSIKMCPDVQKKVTTLYEIVPLVFLHFVAGRVSMVQ